MRHMGVSVPGEARHERKWGSQFELVLTVATLTLPVDDVTFEHVRSTD